MTADQALEMLGRYEAVRVWLEKELARKLKGRARDSEYVRDYPNGYITALRVAIARLDEVDSVGYVNREEVKGDDE